MLRKTLLVAVMLLPVELLSQNVASTVQVDVGKALGRMNMESVGFVDATNSADVDWPDRTGEIRALRPRLIRFFVMDFFDILPAPGKYRFERLDPWIDMILKSGATPLLCIAVKPRSLFPVRDIDVTDPVSYAQWGDLVYNFVRHYKDRNGGGWYWEVANEPDGRFGGGTPYHFTPQGYTRFYDSTVRAIVNADPAAHVGGPALAGTTWEYISDLLAHCDSGHIPINFVSWHIYSNDPTVYAERTSQVKELLGRFPGLHVEKIIDEWGVRATPGISSDAGSDDSSDPRFMCALIAESVYQMKEAGVDASCYFQIRDFPADENAYARFLPSEIGLRAIRSWNRHPLFDGLFDFENHVRPAYYVFKLIAQLTGARLRVESNDTAVHVLASSDESLRLYTILVWNFSRSPAETTLKILHLPSDVVAYPLILDPITPAENDTARLRSLPAISIKAGNGEVPLRLEPGGVTSISLFKQLD